MSTVEQLRVVPLFSDLPEADIERLCTDTEEVGLAAGELLFSEGDLGDRAYVVLDGQIEIVKATVGGEVLLAVQSEGIVGEMALLEDAPRNASVRARSETRLMSIKKARLDELLTSSPSASRAFFEVMLGRWRDTQSSLQQSQRMAQLGTLTAGLAHELNNPAAAVNSSAARVAEFMIRYGNARATVASSLDADSLAIVDKLLDGLHAKRGSGNQLSTLDKADLEYEIETWLTDRGFDRSWELAPGLSDAGMSVGQLSSIADLVDRHSLPAIIELISVAQEQLSLVRQIEEGTRRMSTIVKALESYSYLDQAPVQNIDITSGLDDTLMLIEHRLEEIEVVREYADTLPVIEALGGELNQVWSNLIENAVYSIEETAVEAGRLTVRATPSDTGVTVEVEDNGSGIPEEIRHRVFDSFFTTKPPGSGTGLGLDISRNIVIQHHGGNLSVDSEPGKTTFKVELPLRLPRSSK